MAKASFSDDVMRVIKAAAPVVGGILGSAIPIPSVGSAIGAGVAGMAVDALGKALGVEPTADAINAKIQGEVDEIKASSGEMALRREAALHAKLNSAEDVALARIEADVRIASIKADLENVTNARATFSGKRDWGQFCTGTANVIMVAFTLYCLLTGLVDLKDPLVTGLIGIVIGHVFGWFGGQNNYFYGSSKGSQRNGDTIRNELAKR